MNEWKYEDVQQCLCSAKFKRKDDELIGAAWHGFALYIFLKHEGEIYAERYQWEYLCGMPPSFGIRTFCKSTLQEYYHSVQFSKINLKDFGFDFEGEVPTFDKEDGNDG